MPDWMKLLPQENQSMFQHCGQLSEGANPPLQGVHEITKGCMKDPSDALHGEENDFQTQF